jgi:hypothetical protein
MAQPLSKEAKKEVMKDIILKLHRGLSAEDAKERFEKEVGNVSSQGVATAGLRLLAEGAPCFKVRLLTLPSKVIR